MIELRYLYLGDRWTAPQYRGRVCGPVRRADGRCVVGLKMATALVEFADGTRAVVARRRLRLLSKPPADSA